ncbi:hypothetical protein TNCT_585001 [Trichonephila clavata]|uniref:Uncharacterized protein n=1 Tax=Trichonephila clavata TaxID=2740835 RepID=A0A8X6LEJ3_TRICU|nr:hypothetical protein TNCT_585001 [Trichonephila clavata]
MLSTELGLAPSDNLKIIELKDLVTKSDGYDEFVKDVLNVIVEERTTTEKQKAMELEDKQKAVAVAQQQEREFELEKLNIQLEMQKLSQAPVKCISNYVVANELDRKACGLILIMIYVFTSYSMITCVQRMLTWQVGFPEMAYGCSIVGLFTVITYIYGTCFGVFTYDPPYDLGAEKSREAAVEDDSGRASISTLSDLNSSESFEEISMEELQKILEEISKENDKCIQKAALNNLKRIELLTQETDEYARKLVEYDERLHESYSLETDKYVKISTAEVDENLKLSAAFTEQRVLLATAVDGVNIKRDVVDYIHKRSLDLLKYNQKIESQSTAEYGKLKMANLNRFKSLQSKAVTTDKERSIYIYGTFFGVFTHDLPYNLDTEESRKAAVGDDRGRTSKATVSGLEKSEEISMGDLQKLLHEISTENDERIRKALLENQKRIESLSQKLMNVLKNQLNTMKGSMNHTHWRRTRV